MAVDRAVGRCGRRDRKRPTPRPPTILALTGWKCGDAGSEGQGGRPTEDRGKSSLGW